MAILAVLKRIVAEGHQLFLFAEKVAFKIFKDNDVPCQMVSLENFKRDCPMIVEELYPDLFFLANSWGMSIEKILTMEAKRRGTPSIAILDSWALMDEKFCSDLKGRWYYFPNDLIVMDEHTKKEMIKMGAPENRIIALGQPYLEDNFKKNCKYDQSEIENLRNRLGVSDYFWVVFLSQAMREFYGERRNERYLGYTEYSVFEDLINIINTCDKKIALSIRYHPREEASKFIHLNESVSFPLVVIERENPHMVIEASDLIVGMDTMLLIEAYMGGNTIISYQPGLRKKDQLITNRWGMTPHAYSFVQFKSTFEKYVNGEQSEMKPIQQLELPSNSVENIYNFIIKKCSKSV